MQNDWRLTTVSLLEWPPRGNKFIIYFIYCSFLIVVGRHRDWSEERGSSPGDLPDFVITKYSVLKRMHY